MRRFTWIACLTLLVCLGFGAAGPQSASAAGIFAASYTQSMSFTDALGGSSMTLTWDGTEFWSSSGGSTSGVRYARYAATGALLNTYSPGIDFRSVYTFGDAPPVYARAHASSVIRVQIAPGVFAPHVTLTGGTLDSQSSVVFNDIGTELIAMSGGTVQRWNAATGAFIGTVTLAGFGTMFTENVYPQDRGIAHANGYYVTYSNGSLSAWNAAGTRVGTCTLTGAGTTFDSHFSLSFAQGKVWIVDIAGGAWRGYSIPALSVPCGHIYWTEWSSGKIRRCRFDGSNVQDLVTGLDRPWGIALDSTTDTMYWTEWGTTHTIKRAGFDGTGVTTVVPTGVLDRPSGIKLDLPNGHIYFNQFGATTSGGGPGNLGSGATYTGRVNLNGTGIIVVQDPLSSGRTGIAPDIRGLLTDSVVLAKGRPAAPSDVLQRWDLVPSVLTTVATIADGRFMAGVDLDVANGHIYWSALNSGVFRSDLAAPPANTVNLVPPVGGPLSFTEQPRDLALDLLNGTMYWTYAPPLPTAPAGQPNLISGIRRASLSGAGVTTILAGLDGFQPQGIALDVIVDTTPPTVTCSLMRGILWPPRGGLLPAGLTFSATDDQDFAPVLEVKVYSDEPVGTPPFAPDAMDMGGTWRLRAERSFAGNGRVYLVVVKATDQCGNAGYACCTSVVPRIPTAFWITQALMEATTAKTNCDASGTGDVGGYTQVSP